MNIHLLVDVGGLLDLHLLSNVDGLLDFYQLGDVDGLLYLHLHFLRYVHYLLLLHLNFFPDVDWPLHLDLPRYVYWLGISQNIHGLLHLDLSCYINWLLDFDLFCYVDGRGLLLFNFHSTLSLYFYQLLSNEGKFIHQC